MSREEQLLQEFVRVRITPARILVEVKMPATSGEVLATRWSLAAALPRQASPAQVTRAQRLTLADHRYFVTCDGCGEKVHSELVDNRDDGQAFCMECAAPS